MTTTYQWCETPSLLLFNKAAMSLPKRLSSRNALLQRDSPACAFQPSRQRWTDALRKRILEHAPDSFEDPTILGDLVGAGEIAVLVVPIDKEAPKGRLILPQVQAIRDLLILMRSHCWSKSAS